MASNDIHEIAEKKLASIQQRYSSRRRRLVETLERADHPLIATDIVAIDDDLPQSSVYRNLAVLESAGVVVKVLTNGDRAAFELAEELKGHHHHLVCKSCGETVEIEGGAIEKWASKVGEDHGFREVGHTAEIFGICSKC